MYLVDFKDEEKVNDFVNDMLLRRKQRKLKTDGRRRTDRRTRSDRKFRAKSRREVSVE